jgi:hypothetical protein
MAVVGRLFVVETDPGRLRLIAAIGAAVLLAEVIVLGILLATAPRPAAALPVGVTLRGADGPIVRVPLAAVSAGPAAVVVLVLAAAARLVALPGGAARRRCDAVARNRHPLRWWEWSFTLPITVFLVAQLNGIAEVPALVLVYAVTAGAVLIAALQEAMPAGRPLALMLAAALGIVPWGVIAFVQIGAGLAGHPPSGAVRVLTLLMLAAAAGFLVLVWREQSRVRRDVVDARMERWISLLGVVTPSVLAWIVVLAG